MAQDHEKQYNLAAPMTNPRERVLLEAILEISNSYLGDQTAEDQYLWCVAKANQTILEHSRLIDAELEAIEWGG